MSGVKYTYHLHFEWCEPSTDPGACNRSWKSHIGHRLWKVKIRLADLGVRFSESYYRDDKCVRHEDLDSFVAKRKET